MFKGFYFFSSYRNALKEFHASEDYESQAILVHAMCDYIFDGKEPDLKRADLRAVWQLLRPHLNESIEIERDKEKKREAGKKGAAVTNRKKREKSAERQNSALPKSAERQNSALPKSDERKNKNMNENKNMNASSYEAEAPAPNPFEDEELLEKANHASDVTLFEDGQPTAETFDTSPPKSKGEILDYMQSKGHALEHLNVERFWNYYSQRGWRSKTGVPVIWRQKVDEWVVDDQREKIAELEERRRAGGS